MKALIVRQGFAIGDAIFITAMPRLLKQTKGYDTVDVCVMEHNQVVFQHNPYVDNIITIPDKMKDAEQWKLWLDERGPQYDQVFAVAGHVEMTFLHKTDSSFGGIPTMQERRERAKNVNYIDYILNAMGFEGSGFLPEFYFSAEEEEKRQQILARKKEKKEKLVCWQWEGSSKSKILQLAPVYLEAVRQATPNCQHFIYTSIQAQADAIPTDDPRIHSVFGTFGIRNSIVMASVADLVIGPESFWVNAAAAFQTPVLIFFSHSHPGNLAAHYKNCYVVTPNCECSPCYLICTDFRDMWHPPERRAVARAYEKECQTWDKYYPYRTMGYKCCVDLPHEAIISQIIHILKHGGVKMAKGKGGKKGKGKGKDKGCGCGKKIEERVELLHV